VTGDPYVIGRPAEAWLDAVAADPPPLRVAMTTVTPKGEAVHPDCAAATLQAAHQLEALGHRVVEAAPEWPIDDMMTVLRTLMGVPTKVAVDARLAALGRALRDDDLEPFTRVMYDAAASVPGTAVIEALQLVEGIARSIGAFFDEHDLLLSTVLPDPVPALGHLDTTDISAMVERAGRFSAFTSAFNTTGQPAVSLPLAADAAGRPIGVQLAASFGREDLLLSVAAQLERAHPWSTRPVWPAVVS